MKKTFYAKLEVDLPKRHNQKDLVKDDNLCNALKAFLLQCFNELNKEPKIEVSFSPIIDNKKNRR